MRVSTISTNKMKAEGSKPATLLETLNTAHRNFWGEIFPPTALEFEDIKPDCDRIIATVARQYTDKSCVELHEDELVAEGNRKLCENINKGMLERFAGRRSELFRWITACVNNHVRGLVHKYRFTYKRTGYSPPPKGVVDMTPRPKPEVSFDDPEASVHIPTQCTSDTYSALKGDMAEMLTPLEFLVFKQLTEPNESAVVHATIDSHRGGRHVPLELRITAEHLALGIGVSTEQFLDVQAHVQTKLLTYMQDPTADSSPHAAITALERVFNLRIPHSMEPLIVRRLLTLAARSNCDKIDDKVSALLEAAGARVPKKDPNGNLPCFGVLFKSDNHLCTTCGVRESCSTESANIGLGTVSLSPKLLGARALVRIPQFKDESTAQPVSTPIPVAPTPPVEQPVAVKSPIKRAVKAMITPAPAAPPTVETPPQPVVVEEPPTVVDPPVALLPQPQTTKAVPQNSRENDLEAYLYAHFRGIAFQGELYFRHRISRPDGSVRHCFWLGQVPSIEGGHWALRFCKPSDRLKPKLTLKRISYYLPTGIPVDKAIELIDEHSNDTYRMP